MLHNAHVGGKPFPHQWYRWHTCIFTCTCSRIIIIVTTMLFGYSFSIQLLYLLSQLLGVWSMAAIQFVDCYTLLYNVLFILSTHTWTLCMYAHVHVHTSHLMQVLDQVSKVHHLTLVNTTSSTLQFTLSCTSPHFTLTPSHPTSLSPHSNAEDLTSLPPQTSIRVHIYMYSACTTHILHVHVCTIVSRVLCSVVHECKVIAITTAPLLYGWMCR